MNLTRIIIETQSHEFFCGEESEQDYDQRGGLCQVGAGDVVVTTNPIDTDYLAYWERLGFSLPTIVCAGPFDPQCTITELITQKDEVQKSIRGTLNGAPARIEPFWIADSDVCLPEVLGVPMYCNPDVSMKLACKYNFKLLCEEIGLPTAPWIGASSVQDLIDKYCSSSFQDSPILVKSTNGIGGMNLGGICIFESSEDLKHQRTKLDAMLTPLIAEAKIDVAAEVGVHWEINEEGEVNVIGIFDQLAENFSYIGTAFPTRISQNVKDKIYQNLTDMLLPELLRKKALGFFCCDVLIDSQENIYWTDFNPRKGAILYTFDMVERLSKIISLKKYYVWHQHVALPEDMRTFKKVENCLRNFLQPSLVSDFVVLTSPGLISHGSMDVTGISTRSHESAHQVVRQVKKVLQT